MNATATTERSTVLAQVKQMLEGSRIIAVEYVAVEFIVHLETASRATDASVPARLILALKAEWSVGDKKAWDDDVRAEGSCRRLEPKDMVRAKHLMLMFGAVLERAEILRDGTLVIQTSDGDEWTISGREESLDESWLILPEQGQAGAKDWSVVCDSSGEVFARSPTPTV